MGGVEILRRIVFKDIAFIACGHQQMGYTTGQKFKALWWDKGNDDYLIIVSLSNMIGILSFTLYLKQVVVSLKQMDETFLLWRPNIHSSNLGSTESQQMKSYLRRPHLQSSLTKRQEL